MSIVSRLETRASHTIWAEVTGRKDDTGSKLREWSSLIGIITAIVGNILISCALNIQRYAHIRIEREAQARRPHSRRHANGSPIGIRSYGTTTQEDIAEERARLNAEAPGPGGTAVSRQSHTDDEDENEDDERQPLKASFNSDETLADEKDENDDEDRKSYLKSPYWWFGITLMTIGEAGNFLAYGFAPASIVSPLGVVALISNCVIAPFMLKERFRQRDGWGVLVAIGGAVTVVLSAKQSETKMGPEDLWDAIRRWEFLTYIGITALMMILLMVASPKYGSRTVLIDLGLVGLFGGYTALATKGVASLLSDTLWRALTFPITYVLAVVLVSSALMQIRYINKALQNFDSTQVIPTQFVMFTLSVIIGSAVLYRDFQRTSAEQVGKFIGGCFLTFFGVYLITSGRPKHETAEADDYSDDGDGGIQLIDEEAQYSLKKQHQPTSEPLKVTNATDRPSTPSQDGTVTPRRLSIESSVPSIAVTPTPETGAISAIPSGLDENPWTSSTDPLITTSAPSTPPLRGDVNQSRSSIEIDTPSASTPFYTPLTSRHPPPLNRQTSTPAAPETPTRSKRTVSPAKPDPLLVIGRPAPSPRTRSARNSISRLLPGPFLAPLSSSLSAVVADSVRRGEGSPSLLRRARSARQREREARRRSVDENVAVVSRQQTRETQPEMDSETVRDVVETEDESATKKGRLRAMSETLGRMVKQGKGKERVGGPSSSDHNGDPRADDLNETPR